MERDYSDFVYEHYYLVLFRETSTIMWFVPMMTKIWTPMNMNGIYFPIKELSLFASID